MTESSARSSIEWQWEAGAHAQPVGSSTEVLTTRRLLVEHFAGALVGGSVPAILGTLSYWAGLSGGGGIVAFGLTFLLYLGALAGFICGGLFGPTAIRSREPILTAGVVALAAAPVGLVMLPVVSFLSTAIQSSAGPAPTFDPGPSEIGPTPFDPGAMLAGLVGLAFLLLVFLIFAYAFGLPVAFPSAVIAIYLLRRIVRLPVLFGSAMVALLVAAAITGSVATYVDTQRPHPELVSCPAAPWRADAPEECVDP